MTQVKKWHEFWNNSFKHELFNSITHLAAILSFKMARGVWRLIPRQKATRIKIIYLCFNVVAMEFEQVVGHCYIPMSNSNFWISIDGVNICHDVLLDKHKFATRFFFLKYSKLLFLFYKYPILELRYGPLNISFAKKN